MFSTLVACWFALSIPLANLIASSTVSWSCSSFFLTFFEFSFSVVAINISVSSQLSGNSQCLPSALSLAMNESHGPSFPCLMHRNLCMLYNWFCDSLNLVFNAAMAPSVPVLWSCSKTSSVASPIESRNSDRCCVLSVILYAFNWLCLNRSAYFMNRTYTVSGSLRISNSGNCFSCIQCWSPFCSLSVDLHPRGQFNVERSTRTGSLPRTLHAYRNNSNTLVYKGGVLVSRIWGPGPFVSGHYTHIVSSRGKAFRHIKARLHMRFLMRFRIQNALYPTLHECLFREAWRRL